MSSGLSTQKLKELKAFLQTLKSNPQLLHLKELDFFKEFMEDFGAIIPENIKIVEEEEVKSSSTTSEDMPDLVEEESIPVPKEEPLNLDDKELMEPDNDAPLEVGDASVEVTEEMMDNANNFKMEAVGAKNEGKLQDAVDLFTKAIKSNPRSGILYGSRAEVLLLMKKPNAAIRDCDIAIGKNPDSAKPYKVRAKAHRALGHYEQALKDIQVGQKLDFDDSSHKLEHDIKQFVDKIVEHKKKQEANRAQQSKPQQHSHAKPQANPFGGASPFNIPGIPPEMAQKLMSDPEVQLLMQDPVLMAKLTSAMSDPSKLAELQKDPRVAKLMSKFMGM